MQQQQWERIKGFGDFEGDGNMWNLPVELDERNLQDVIDDMVRLIANNPGYKSYRFNKIVIKKRHCSNCEETNEWFLEGLKHD